MKPITLPHLKSLEITGLGHLPVIAPSLTSLGVSENEKRTLAEMLDIMEHAPQLLSARLHLPSQRHRTREDLQDARRFVQLLKQGRWTKLEELCFHPTIDGDCLSGILKIKSLRKLQIAGDEDCFSAADVYKVLNALPELEELQVDRGHKRTTGHSSNSARWNHWKNIPTERKVFKSLKILNLSFATNELFGRMAAPSLQTLTLRGYGVVATFLGTFLQSIKSSLLILRVFNVSNAFKMLSSARNAEEYPQFDSGKDSESDSKLVAAQLPSIRLTLHSQALTAGMLYSVLKTLGPFLLSLDLELSHETVGRELACLPDILAAITMPKLQIIRAEVAEDADDFQEYCRDPVKLANLFVTHTALRSLDIGPAIADKGKSNAFGETVLKTLQRELPGDTRAVRLKLCSEHLIISAGQLQSSDD